MENISTLLEKWDEVINHPDETKLSASKKADLAVILENQQKDMNERRGYTNEILEDVASANVTGNIGKFDPVMISMIRRSYPNMIAYDVCGVQPMSAPSGLIFAKRPRYVNPDRTLGAEAFYNEPNTAFTGAGSQTGTDPSVLNNSTPGAYTTGTGMATATGELLGTDANLFPEIGFEVEKITVTAQTRGVKASMSMEMLQDLKAVHGLDGETELINDLSADLLAELNREVVRTIYITAKIGSQQTDLTTAGVFDLDTDSNGRWSKEKFQGMLFQIEREANKIAKDTRLGKGNYIICSSDVASALMFSGMLSYTPSLDTDLIVDDTGNLFAGVLNRKFKVFVDPFVTGDYFVVGHKGASAWQAGLFYCPYVPLQLTKAMSSETLSPRLGFRTRYGLVAHPYAQGITKGSGALTSNTNLFLRRTKISNLSGSAI